MKKIISSILAVCMLAMAMIVTPMSVEAAPVELPQASLGIDVSRFQGEIDWSKVAASGINFAMIRIGARTSTTGILQEDEYAKYNLQEANKYGIKVGAYFFSTAVTAEEAVEEANFVCNILDKYQITFPVAYDCENYNKSSSRQYKLTKAQRTALACNFMDAVTLRGYTPMFYGNKNSMQNSKDWDMTTISAKYKVWIAWYPADPFPITTAPDYTGIYSMWQYSEKMVIPGITENVDINVSYFDYSEIAAAKDATGAVAVTTASNSMYTPVNDVVTSTTSVNIRTTPDTSATTNIIGKLEPGMAVWRTGVGNNGWSQVLINNQTFYISTNYLKIMK